MKHWVHASVRNDIPHRSSHERSPSYKRPPVKIEGRAAGHLGAVVQVVRGVGLGAHPEDPPLVPKHLEAARQRGQGANVEFSPTQQKRAVNVPAPPVTTSPVSTPSPQLGQSVVKLHADRSSRSTTSECASTLKSRLRIRIRCCLNSGCDAHLHHVR